jgi:ATP-dependent DNA helicase RecG
MNAEDIRALLDKNEDEHIEFKKAESSFDFDKLVEYSVALANEHGGLIVLGITDKKPRRIVGSSAYLDDLAKIKERLIAQVRLRIDVEELRCPEGRVLVFHVPSRPIGMPIGLNGIYLMRAGGSLTGMSADMLKRIFDEAEPDFSAELCPKAIIDDLEPQALGEFRARWALKSGNDRIKNLSDRQLLEDAELTVGGTLTYAALILFGKHESLGRLLANAEVVFEYRSSEASGPAQQRIEFRQGFLSFFDKLWEAIDLRNTKQHFQDGFFIWDVPTFNERAIREAILNAVSHREYRMTGSVFVRQYGERIEITNPGGLPPGVTLETILWMQAPRNRRLAEAFARCGLVERSGQGMNRIYESCILESKAEPDFTHSDTYNFWITLHGSIRQPEFLRLLEKIGRERLVSFSLEDLIVIQAVYDGRPIGERFKAATLRLVDEGLLERNTRRSKNPWILSRKLYAAIGKSGVHTRKKGLDRETNKELLIKHLHASGPEGARMEELLQVLPTLDRHTVRYLLLELQDEKRAHVSGKTSAARWHEGRKEGLS